MRTLEQIREDNKNCHLLYNGMEEDSIDLPSAFREREQEIYKTFVKPVSRKTVIKHLDK